MKGKRMMVISDVQKELIGTGSLLTKKGEVSQVGWARQPLLDCNLEKAAFYALRPLQHLRMKRWDYYGLITEQRFYSFTLADLGYAGQVFAYVVDFARQKCEEATLTVPFGNGIHLTRNSNSKGTSSFDNGNVRLSFQASPGGRKISVNWPGFCGKGLSAEVQMSLPEKHESMVIVIPIGTRRFYYNRKVNCMPCFGWVQYGTEYVEIKPERHLGNLDWGRGVWDYRSFWVWASASGFLSDGGTLGLNLGFGFGDTSAATENTILINGCNHKLGQVSFHYNPQNFKEPWKMSSSDGRLDLTFTPFLERVAKTDLKVITSEVHQMFGRYTGKVVSDEGKTIPVDGLVGFAEEHHAKW
jgi:hypothetical protein